MCCGSSPSKQHSEERNRLPQAAQFGTVTVSAPPRPSKSGTSTIWNCHCAAKAPRNPFDPGAQRAKQAATTPSPAPAVGTVIVLRKRPETGCHNAPAQFGSCIAKVPRNPSILAREIGCHNRIARHQHNLELRKPPETPRPHPEARHQHNLELRKLPETPRPHPGSPAPAQLGTVTVTVLRKLPETPRPHPAEARHQHNKELSLYCESSPKRHGPTPRKPGTSTIRNCHCNSTAKAPRNATAPPRGSPAPAQ